MSEVKVFYYRCVTLFVCMGMNNDGAFKENSENFILKTELLVIICVACTKPNGECNNGSH